MPAEIQFLRPLWFLVLLPLPFLLWKLSRVSGGADAWRGLVDEHLLAHLLADDGARVRRFPLMLLAFGWLLGVLALAGPVWERLPQPVFQTEAQRVIAFDISAGMNAEDLPPSRLARARFEVLDMLAQTSEGQTALLAYGAEPFIVSPLTSDADTIAAQVPDLETALMPVRGPKRTDLALEEAGGLLRRAGSLEGDIILVTDALGRPVEARAVAERLREEGYRVSVLGIGTEKGAPVPLPDGGFLTDEQGAIVLPRLRPEQLRTLAAAGGGRYVELSTDDSDTRALLPRGRERLSERGAEQDARADQWREEGPWLLLALLPLTALAFRRGWLSPLVLPVLMVSPPSADALGWEDLWWRADQQGARTFSAGEHELAAERFQRPDWRAAAQYESGAYEQALESLDALDGLETAYNRGNAMVRLGSLEEALDQYDQVLAQDPDHADARHNRDLVQRLLEQQQQEQSQQGGQDGQQDDSDSQDRDGQQDRSGQDENDTQDRQQDQSGAQDSSSEQSDPRDGQGNSQDQGQSDDRSGADSGQPPEEQPTGQHDSPEGADGQPGASAGQGEQEPNRQGSPENDREQPRSPEDSATDTRLGGQDGSPADRAEEPGSVPDLNDLLGDEQARGRPPVSAPMAKAEQGSNEDRQAMEHMLRRVPDDPGGLLRQRFLLQHLRRSGRLP